MQELQQFQIHGEEIVKEAIKNEIRIIPIPGACALINALIASGLDTREFSFYAFLPLNKKLKRKKFDEIKKDSKTAIIYEAPHKLLNTLKDILNILGDKNIVLAKEITKIHEKFVRGKVSEVLKTIDTPKGEYIILIEGEKIEEENALNAMTIEEQYNFYENQGLCKKEIIKKIARDRGVSKNEIYQKFI